MLYLHLVRSLAVELVEERLAELKLQVATQLLRLHCLRAVEEVSFWRRPVDSMEDIVAPGIHPYCLERWMLPQWTAWTSAAANMTIVTGNSEYLHLCLGAERDLHASAVATKLWPGVCGPAQLQD